MNLLPGLTWLTAMATRRAPQGDDEPDPADMGTAFGLDASMAPEEPDARHATEASRPSVAAPPTDRLIRRPRR
ncbi:MAG: hypothetical protein ABI605_01845 [Rhizobacter sp.]